ncbi:type VI secretion system protein TssA [Undibacterium sp. Xuan67W]|uniref:type VI secretion system protein TssA n=1 Tax=Undibacterium sp. Xuan67W TaxID=3413057 RepID=UPI003BEF9640
MLAVDQLLLPINPTDPCGEDLSFSTELDAIAQARRFDDPSLDQGEWVAELKEADWPFVVKNCSDLIQSKSKDLRLAVWLAEASAKVNQFRGLGDAYLLLAGLCDKFWEGLYPLPDEDGYGQRIGNLHWLLKRSVQLVREIPITEGKDSGYSTIQFELARANSTNEDRQDASRHHGHLKLADVESARKKSSRAFYQNLLTDARYCISALIELEQAVDAWLGIDGPGFTASKEALEAVIRLILPFARDVGAQTESHPVEEPEMTIPILNNEQKMSAITPLAGTIQTRTQALAQLRLVAEFFRRTEPHSPVIYLAEKAADWGDLPLHEWLRAVVKDEGSLGHIEELLGIKR